MKDIDDLPITIYFYPLLMDNNADTGIIKQFIDSLKLQKDNESVLYIHIPYCISHCSFCPFNTKVVPDTFNMSNYIEALIKEAKMIAPYIMNLRYKSIYYGGGSPSIMRGIDFAYFHNALKEILHFDDSAEVSLEGELRTLTSEHRLEIYKSLGVKRISFGMQTFDNSLRKSFNIPYDADSAISMINDLAGYGFQDINADMMYGLPGQGVRELRNDIDCLRKIEVNSIDYYRLHPYSLPKSKKGSWINHANQLKPKFVKTIVSELPDMGFKNVCDQVYSRVGLSEYSRLLWGKSRGQTASYMVGLGASARGYLNGRSYMNIPDINDYEAKIFKGDFPVVKISDSCLELERRRVFSPKYFFIPEDLLPEQNSVINESIHSWIEKGLIIRSNNGYILTDIGKIYVDEMIIDLMSSKQYAIATGLEDRISVIDNLRTGRF